MTDAATPAGSQEVAMVVRVLVRKGERRFEADRHLSFPTEIAPAGGNLVQPYFDRELADRVEKRIGQDVAEMRFGANADGSRWASMNSKPLGVLPASLAYDVIAKLPDDDDEVFKARFTMMGSSTPIMMGSGIGFTIPAGVEGDVFDFYFVPNPELAGEMTDIFRLGTSDTYLDHAFVVRGVKLVPQGTPRRPAGETP